MIRSRLRGKTVISTLAAMAACLIMTIGMTACGTSQDAAPEETTQPPATETTAAPADNTTQAGGQNEIGEERALEIALQDAGLNKTDVSYPNSHLDIDDGRAEYDVEFHQGTKEYSYSIDAYSGAILEKDVDLEDD